MTMRLVTSVKPRKDGTVIVEDGSEQYTFAANADGVLEGEVPDGLAAKLIAGGWFEPAANVAVEVPPPPPPPPPAEPVPAEPPPAAVDETPLAKPAVASNAVTHRKK